MLNNNHIENCDEYDSYKNKINTVSKKENEISFFESGKDLTFNQQDKDILNLESSMNNLDINHIQDHNLIKDEKNSYDINNLYEKNVYVNEYYKEDDNSNEYDFSNNSQDEDNCCNYNVKNQIFNYTLNEYNDNNHLINNSNFENEENEEQNDDEGIFESENIYDYNYLKDLSSIYLECPENIERSEIYSDYYNNIVKYNPKYNFLKNEELYSGLNNNSQSIINEEYVLSLKVIICLFLRI